MPRLQGKKYFLTYPQCTLSKEEVSEKLQAIVDITTFTIARELHQDGTPHIHACLILSRSPRTSDMRFFDLDGFHPNIKSLSTNSDFDRVNKYCQKDGDFITNVEKRLSPRAALFQALQRSPDGLSINFVKEHPEIMAYSFDSIRRWVSFIHPTLRVPQLQLLPKRRHIWFYGPSNTGKSTWLYAYLQCYFQPEEIPRNNDFHGIDASTDCLFFDEYRGQLSVQELNRLCDGRAKLNTKGGGTFIGYPIIVVVSNFSISETYYKSDPEEINSVMNRFNQYVSTSNRPKFPTREL